jgi:hypothetical protein
MGDIFKGKKQQPKTKPQTTTAVKDGGDDLGFDELFATDLARVKSTKGDEKNILKQQIINKYQEHFDKLVSTGNLNSDFVFWMIAWHLDIGLVDEIYDTVLLAIDNGLKTPFKSNFITFVTDSLREYFAKSTNIDHHIVFDFVIEYRDHKDVNRIAMAKLLKLAGDLSTNDEEILEFYENAFALDEGVGVKKKITALKKTTCRQ